MSIGKSTRSPGRGAFTLLELLVVVGIIGILAGLLLPVLSMAKSRAATAQDLNNKSQMMRAWTMYAGDFSDYMVPNSPINYGASVAWVDSINGLENWGFSEPPSSGNTNYALLQHGLLAPYLSGQVGVYKCPADRLNSANGPRLRSVSMNGQMGAIGQTISNAPGSNNKPGLLYTRMADLNCPSPAMAIVFLDESMTTLQDGYLQVDSHGTAGFFPDIPANYHNGGCCLGYADGHAEVHKWTTGSLLSVPYSQSIGYPDYTITAMDKNNADWQWWIQRVDCDPN
jgi:prepilin-type N-terminal cleavage/methylation domain-containing protein/prepilin-type processing-associated H-X9-DG protein